LDGQGNLENNGHFLRGGLVVVSSQNPLLTSRVATSRNFDRVMHLHEVGQIFSNDMDFPGSWPVSVDRCGGDGKVDTATFPCEGFFQNTLLRASSGGLLDVDWRITPFVVDLSQIDPPPGPGDFNFAGVRLDGGANNPCPVEAGAPAPPHGSWPPAGLMVTLGTGFYASGNDCASRTYYPVWTPYGARILGQTATQLFTNPPTTANRFGQSLAVSGNFLLIGAPNRTCIQEDVWNLPTASRSDCGEIYMLNLTKYWHLPNVDVPTPADPYIPVPHNYIIDDLGYIQLEGSDCVITHSSPESGLSRWEMSHPLHVVGANAGDRIGEVTGLYDINNDGIDDFAVGGAGTNGTRGTIYIIYRRQPELEGNYLLEHLGLDPSSLNRLNGLMIVGQPNENLGTAIAGGGALSDDYNGDGKADLLIGSPVASPASRFEAGRVFILFGGKNIVNPAGGCTLDDLYATNEGMFIIGAEANDHAGTTVSNAGDVNGDGITDILIAAPDASPKFDSDDDGFADTIGLDLDGDGFADDLDGDSNPDDMTNAGIVYLVYGGEHLTGTIGLEDIGSENLPGMVFVGRKGGDRLGGGQTQTGQLSRGITSAGDIDGDGRADLLISSILADPADRHNVGGGSFVKTNAGEVYLIYGTTP